MLAAKALEIEAVNAAILDDPAALDHDPVGMAGATENEGRQRVAMTREAWLVEGEHGEIRLGTHGDPAQLGPSDTCGRALGRPAQGIFVRDLVGTIQKTLKQKGLADF